MREIGIGITWDTWRLRFGWSSEFHGWTPGEIESGSSTPAEYFDAMSDHYWKWGWLWFVVFYAEAR